MTRAHLGPVNVAVEPPADLPRALADLVGGSAAMHALRRRLALIARATGSVLVQGASGTGKELAARAIHDLSSRAAGPFISVDCGALAESLLESELFGHARGAFTGAAGERAGLFEAAHGGTLLLDEIGNTSLAVQARLLRALEEREVRRIGCNVPRGVDVRVIAATNRDLHAAAAEGEFREDLLYRLDVLGVRMPSLAERREDIPDLCRALLAGMPRGREARISFAALVALEAHDWPGNVRELRNALERALAFADGGCIDVAHLPDRLARATGVVTREPQDAAAMPRRAPSLQQLLHEYERRLLAAHLHRYAWNRTRAARELGITRRTLFTKIAKHGLEEDGLGPAKLA